jgi:alginate O-acetyltransferase complex protein AlgI
MPPNVPSPVVSLTINHRRPVAGWGAAVLAVAGVAWLTWEAPGWFSMSALALTEFFLLKLALAPDAVNHVALARRVGFFLLYPGMDTRAFFAPPREGGLSVRWSELAFAAVKLGAGLALASWAVVHVDERHDLLVAWVGMLGIIFSFHFGLFHVVSWAWRRAGVEARPIMRAPILSASVAELWGTRWNLAFADAARRLLLRPLSRRFGAPASGGVVFLVSGLAHETVISVPAHGGWGGPTLYFLIHALAVAAERSPLGRHIGLDRGWTGRVWTLAVAVLPLPLLFHRPFAERVIVPLFRFLKEVL